MHKLRNQKCQKCFTLVLFISITKYQTPKGIIPESLKLIGQF